jgi:hypothetical protein
MVDKTVLQFQEIVESFKEVLDEVSIRCVAIRNEDKWISIYTGLILKNSKDSNSLETKIAPPGSELIALSVPCPRKDFEMFLKETESGSLLLNTGPESHQIFLNRSAAGLKTQNISGPRLQFQNVWRPLRQYSLPQETFQPTIILQALGDRFYEVISPEDNARISKALRAHRPAYDGLEGLLQFFGSRNRPNGSTESVIEMKAVLPFRTTIREDQVFVECPSAVAPKVSVLYFFRPMNPR